MNDGNNKSFGLSDLALLLVGSVIVCYMILNSVLSSCDTTNQGMVYESNTDVRIDCQVSSNNYSECMGCCVNAKVKRAIGCYELGKELCHDVCMKLVIPNEG